MQFQWTEDKYRKICKACDFVLQSALDNKVTIANPWLHVLRPHPEILRSYEVIFKNSSIKDYLIGWCRRVLCHLRLFQALFNKNNYCARKLPNYSDVLIISHVINKNDVGNKNDFYFGDLSEQLETNGIKVTVALINHTNEKSTSIAKENEHRKKTIFLKNLLDFKVEYKLLKESKCEALRLEAEALKNYPEIYGKVFKHAADLIRQGKSLNSLRLGEQIKELVSKLKPKIIVLTYEGHSWERLAFSVSKSASPNILRIGYQHSAIFNLQHGLQRMLGKSYDPDIIMTTGEISKNQLIRNLSFEKEKIRVLGTPKFFEIQKKDNLNKKLCCIVLPEGFESECNKLFSYSIQCATLMPEIEFILRMHPILNKKKFINKYSKYRKLPKNVSISNQHLISDLKRANFALYRGSTSIIQAVAFGIYPIYLDAINEISIDPLYEVEKLRANVINPNDFIKVIKNFNNKSTYEIQKYCKALYMPLDSLPIKKLL